MSSTDSRTVAPSTFHSILFERDEGVVDDALEPPDFFADLHLDEVVASLTAGREEYDLAPLFYRPLHELEEVQYRHHVLSDLEQAPVLAAIREFAREMQQMRKHLQLLQKLHYVRQQQRWLLEAVAVYCRAVRRLREHLKTLELHSRGLLALRDYGSRYVESGRFARLVHETTDVVQALAAVRYAVLIKGNRVRVSPYEREADLSEEIERAFEKFKQGEVTDYRLDLRNWADMNHVEARILELVAKLNPETFLKLEEYCTRT